MTTHSYSHPPENEEYPYPFDTRMVRRNLPPCIRPRGVAIIAVLAFFCIAWMGAQEVFTRKSYAAFEREQSGLYHSVRTRMGECDHINGIIASFDTGISPQKERELALMIVDLADYYRMDPYLIVGVIRVESYFYNEAISVAGAEGLMQVLPVVGEEVARELGLPYQFGKTLFDPMSNVQIGTHYLAYLLEHFDGDVELALLAYNRGPNGLKRALYRGEGVPTEYADDVLFQYQRYLNERNLVFFGRREI